MGFTVHTHSPLPETIEWFIDTQDTESTLKRVHYFDDRSRVLVTGVDSMDVGTYTCAAAGLENSSAALTVRGLSFCFVLFCFVLFVFSF